MVARMQQLTGYPYRVRYVHDLLGSSTYNHDTRAIIIRAHAFYEPSGLRSVFLHEMAHSRLPIWATEFQVDMEAVRLAEQIFGNSDGIILPFVD